MIQAVPVQPNLSARGSSRNAKWRFGMLFGYGRRIPRPIVGNTLQAASARWAYQVKVT